ncbi:MAG: HU family DNA-binding protein [Salinispira sp.]
MPKEKMTKAAIVDTIANETGLTRTDVQHVVNETLVQLKSAIASSQVVELRGFGTFELRVRKGRDRARNPKTGQIVAVEDHGVVVFRPGKELKDIAWPLC